jgi:transcriptional regulator with XRE-family HTH domain
MTSARKKATLNLIDKHVGGRLRMRRMMLDMSQEKLADAFGITFQQVQKYEKGTNRISAGRLQHAANLLQVPVQFFFQGAPVGSGTQPDGSARSPAYVSEFVSSSDGLRLIKAFTRIESGVRRRIVDLVQDQRRRKVHIEAWTAAALSAHVRAFSASRGSLCRAAQYLLDFRAIQETAFCTSVGCHNGIREVRFA